jgi:hypothetical protein
LPAANVGAAPVIHIGAETNPGVYLRAISRGEGPSLITTDFPAEFLAVTTRLKLMVLSLEDYCGGSLAETRRGHSVVHG